MTDALRCQKCSEFLVALETPAKDAKPGYGDARREHVCARCERLELVDVVRGLYRKVSNGAPTSS